MPAGASSACTVMSLLGLQRENPGLGMLEACPLHKQEAFLAQSYAGLTSSGLLFPPAFEHPLYFLFCSANPYVWRLVVEWHPLKTARRASCVEVVHPGSPARH